MREPYGPGVTGDDIVPAETTCATCKFVKRDGSDIFCHRYPPTLLIIGGVPHTGWPEVDKKSWCGEYAPLLNWEVCPI